MHPRPHFGCDLAAATPILLKLRYDNLTYRRSEVKIMKIEIAYFLCCLGPVKENRPILASKIEAPFAPEPFKV